jgi:hypothetical protein
MDMDRREDEVREKALIFVHVPRTAGTTLSMTIERQFSAEAVFPGTLSVRRTRRTLRVLLGKRYTVDQIMREFRNLSKDQKRKIEYLHGHVSFGVHTGLLRPSVYVTMLRDPVDRVVSLYYFLRRRPDIVYYDQIRTMSLKDLFSDTGPHSVVRNAQVRQISGADIDAPLSVDTLEIAKEHLREHFVMVGLTERFNESLLLLGRTFGWKWRDLLYSRRYQVGKNKPRQDRISPSALGVIRKCNELDIELYRFAQRMFEESVRKQGETFSQELQAFERQLSSFQGRPQVVAGNWLYDLAVSTHIWLQFGMRRIRRAIESWA